MHRNESFAHQFGLIFVRTHALDKLPYHRAHAVPVSTKAKPLGEQALWCRVIPGAAAIVRRTQATLGHCLPEAEVS